MVNNLALMTGIDLPIPELAITIHQPTIKDISFLGEEEYFTYLQLICFKKDFILSANPEGKTALQNLNNFQIFMMMMSDSVDNANAEAHRRQVKELFILFFPNYQLQFTPRALFLVNQETKANVIIDENNFDKLQEFMSAVSGLNNILGGNNSQYNPKGKLAQEIAEKLKKAHEKMNKGQAESFGILSRYISILTVGLSGMSLQDCLNLTVYQLFDLMERFGLHTSWDIDLKCRLAGGKPDNQPDDWMKDLH